MSEAKAFEACADLANEILEAEEKKGTKLKGKDGKEQKGTPAPIRYTGHELMTTFVGQNFRGMLGGLKERHGYEMDPEVLDKYVARELDAVIHSLNGKPDKNKNPTSSQVDSCEAVVPELEKLAASNKYLLSVVSSSAYSRVYESVRITEQLRFFKDDHIYSAASSLNPPKSKPDPEVYIHAMKRLGFYKAQLADPTLKEPKGDKETVEKEYEKYSLKPEECVAVEDSRSGATAAWRAGIPTIGYTGSYETEQEKRDAKKTLEDAGVANIMEHWTQFEEKLAEIESGQVKRNPNKDLWGKK